MSIGFTRTKEEMLIFAISDEDRNPTGGALYFSVKSKDLIHVYKKGSNDKLFSSLHDFSTSTFIMEMESDKNKYVFKEN